MRRPEQFEVLVTTNMNGDILSDLTSGLIGGLGFAPSANLGSEVAIFEAVHGSAPKYAGKNVINPTALILTGAMMLRFLGFLEEATNIEQAVFVTLESGIKTRDIAGDEKATSTSNYTDAIIQNLGKRSSQVNIRPYKPYIVPTLTKEQESVVVKQRRETGVDVFVEASLTPEELGTHLEQLTADLPIHLKMISNRGTKVYAPTGAMTDCVNHWRCRFVLNDANVTLNDETILTLLPRIGAHYRWMHIEKLPEFDGAAGFTRAQGEDDSR